MPSRSFRTMVLALLVSFGFVEVASAYYSPRLGRFLNRDPIGEPGAMLVRHVATTAFIPRDIQGGEPNPYLTFRNNPNYWIDPDGLAAQETQPATQPTSGPSEPVDICKLLGGKGCDGRHVPPGLVSVPVNLGTLGKLSDLCGHLTIDKVKSCTDSLKWKDVAAFGGKPCSLIKMDVCKALSQYADGKRYDFPCMKKDGDNWVVDPDKECCCKVKFKGSYDVDVPVSITVPVAADTNGKNGGLCIITGNIKASLDTSGELGQCEKKRK
ncbi:MAG: hypothetical protein AB7N65_10060 [Vicinamibacterales bacterium]